MRSLVQSGAMSPIIALLTDFGLKDAYVGIMKGVMLSICPTARLVDLTHDIRPQDVRQAAYVLLTAYRYFPPETVFLVVVDPGVGTARAPLAVETAHGRFVAPDNGVLSYVLRETPARQAVALSDPAYHLREISQTFHGRDIFSPVAAHLAQGTPITALGPTQRNLVLLPAPRLSVSAREVVGEVLHIDHFGNLITSIGQLTWEGADRLRLTPRFGGEAGSSVELMAVTCRVQVGDYQVGPIRRTYGEVSPGQATALIGSAGQLEIGVNQGHAAERYQAAIGDPVWLRFA
ncbi:MAG: SAM-dependent chlorinase/fluorinase [Anaerolineae bacterium]